jgi:hypothetical protein
MNIAPAGQARAHMPQALHFGINSIQTSCRNMAFSGQQPTQAPQ